MASSRLLPGADMTSQNTIIADLQAQVEQLQAALSDTVTQRDQLLAALRMVAAEVTDGVRPTSADSHLPVDVVREVQAAIAAVEQTDAAPAADAGGWIEWKGGERPVPADCVVRIKFHDDDVDTIEAGLVRWNWDFDGKSGGDIIAYRVVKGGAA